MRCSAAKRQPSSKLGQMVNNVTRCFKIRHRNVAALSLAVVLLLILIIICFPSRNFQPQIMYVYRQVHTFLPDRKALLPMNTSDADAELAAYLTKASQGLWKRYKDGYRNVSGMLSSIAMGKQMSVCIGSNGSLGEVEDFFCMDKPKYVSGMKNPCWWENTTNEVKSPSAISVNVTSVSVSLSCLPYFHILCCSKSGTTDMFRRISLHPDIVPNFGIFGKERLYWSWAKYGWGYKGVQPRENVAPLESYTKGFGILARYLESAQKQGNTKDLKRYITLDGSPPDMWDMRGWTRLPQNRGLRQPVVLTPHLMKHLYRNPKFLILVRNPVDRLFTAYLFHRMGTNAYDFHKDVLKSISTMNRCLDFAENRIECFVNASINNDLIVDLHYSCYAVFFEEWFKVFPKRHFLILRTEDYSDDLKGSLLKIFDFLNLSRPSAKEMLRMLTIPRSYHTKQRDFAGSMLEETRLTLTNWYRPWNNELARLMKSKAFLWKDHVTLEEVTT